MNKPSWNDAPEWARYLAQDGDENEPHWAWYQEKPYIHKQGWVQSYGRYQETNAGTLNESWRDTLERRP